MSLASEVNRGRLRARIRADDRIPGYLVSISLYAYCDASPAGCDAFEALVISLTHCLGGGSQVFVQLSRLRYAAALLPPEMVPQATVGDAARELVLIVAANSAAPKMWIMVFIGTLPPAVSTSWGVAVLSTIRC